MYDLLNNEFMVFDGIDGHFRLNNNIIKRNLDILKISKVDAYLVKKLQ